MIDAEVAVSYIDQTVITAPAVGMDDAFNVGALMDAEYGRLPIGPAPTFAFHAFGAKQAFIHFHDARKAPLLLAMLRNPLPDQAQIPVDRVDVQTRQSGNLDRRQVGSKVFDKLPEFASESFELLQ